MQNVSEASLFRARDTTNPRHDITVLQYCHNANSKSWDKWKISRLTFQFAFDDQTETKLATCLQADSIMRIFHAAL